MDININIDLYCNLTQPAQEGLRLLINSTASVLSLYPPTYLRRILILPHADIAQMVNDLVEQFTGQQGTYQPDSANAAEGVAVPCEAEGELHCFILLAAERVELLTLGHFHSQEVVTTLLEEWLHVWLYGVVWEKRGYFTPRSNPEEPCEIDFVILVSRMFDEYIVIRHKAELMAAVPLIDYEGGLVTGRIMYGDDVTARLHRCEAGLKRVLLGVGMRRTSVAEAWPDMLGHLYRDLLDPLGRNAAYCDAYEEEQETDNELYTPFFRRCFATHWQEIHRQLQRVYEELNSYDEAVALCVGQLRQFLASIGMTYQRTDNGECDAHFDAAFFLGWRNGM